MNLNLLKFLSNQVTLQVHECPPPAKGIKYHLLHYPHCTPGEMALFPVESVMGPETERGLGSPQSPSLHFISGTVERNPKGEKKHFSETGPFSLLT